jgi:hypothetical protein
MSAAKPPPRKGPTQYIQWFLHLHPIKAGPKALAGFIEAPSNGPPTKIFAPTMNPIARGAMIPKLPLLGSRAVAYTV